jgi:acetyl-CoA carboxylase biotin carboxyl carrier protein
MDLRKLKTLIDLVADSTIAELEVTEGESKVRIVKTVNASIPQMQYLPMQMPGAVAAPAAPPAIADVPPPAEREGNIVKAPMVGTFYRAPGPDKPPYVEIGQAVKSAEPICIIEAMKLLNEIESGFDGVVKEILVENGQPVEFGQPLFVVV